MVKKLLKSIFRKPGKISSPAENRKELEKKVVEGAEKAVKEYRRVFERLSEYDKA